MFENHYAWRVPLGYFAKNDQKPEEVDRMPEKAPTSLGNINNVIRRFVSNAKGMSDSVGEKYDKKSANTFVYRRR